MGLNSMGCGAPFSAWGHPTDPSCCVDAKDGGQLNREGADKALDKSCSLLFEDPALEAQPRHEVAVCGCGAKTVAGP